MSGHTPGPWAVSKAKPRRVTANGKIICNAVLANGPGNANVKAEDEAAANALLIAAAPDGLALASLIGALTGNVDHSRGGGENTARLYGGMLNDIRDAAHKFIARATASVGGA